MFVRWCWLQLGCELFLGGLFGLLVGGISVDGVCVLVFRCGLSWVDGLVDS